jgi:alkylglycerol monooxygenase
MDTYASILLIAMPIFLGLVVAEKLYGYFKKGDAVKPMDTVSSLSSGVTNSLKDVLGLTFTVLSYNFLVENIAVYSVPSGFWTVVVAFIVLDFSGYWVHRIAHQVNFFWNKHAIHHSSEEFNLGCALRQSISTFVNIFTFFLIPAALLGVPASVIAIVAPLHLFAQFWYHTVYIGKMGFLEKIIVTPSHHRVHHAINPEYLDKNHSQIFIIWDKLFGTFQEELDDVPPVYGITRPVRTWNPIKINFAHLSLLIQDAWRTKSWRDKFRIWFMPTGWRPEDVVDNYPVTKIDDVYNFEKYEPKLSLNAQVFVYVQFFFTFLILSLFYYTIAQFSLLGYLSMGLFIFWHVFSYTDFMDKNKSSFLVELSKNAFALCVLYVTDWWMPLIDISGFILFFLTIYFVVSTFVNYFLIRKEVKEPQDTLRPQTLRV